MIPKFWTVFLGISNIKAVLTTKMEFYYGINDLAEFMRRFFLNSCDEFTNSRRLNNFHHSVRWFQKKPSAGVQFVKPRIYQTGGGEWKSVNYENPEDLSLKQKLKMLGIDHEEGTKECFHFFAQWWVIIDDSLTNINEDSCDSWFMSHESPESKTRVFEPITTVFLRLLWCFSIYFYCVSKSVHSWFKSKGC